MIRFMGRAPGEPITDVIDLFVPIPDAVVDRDKFGHDPWAEGVPKSFEPVLELRCDLLAGVRSRASGGDDRLTPVARTCEHSGHARRKHRPRPTVLPVTSPGPIASASDMSLEVEGSVSRPRSNATEAPSALGPSDCTRPLWCDRGRHNAPVHPLGSSRPNRSARSNRPKRVASAPRASLCTASSA